MVHQQKQQKGSLFKKAKINGGRKRKNENMGPSHFGDKLARSQQRGLCRQCALELATKAVQQSNLGGWIPQAPSGSGSR